MSFFSNLIVPLVLCMVFLRALVQRVDLLSAFARGVREGLQVVLDMFPSLMLLTLAACGSNSDPSGNGDAAVSGTTDSAEEATATVSGVVNRLDDYLVLLTEDETYAVFDFGEDVDPAELEEGDSVTVTYTGELGSEDPAPVAVSITKSETA